MTARAAARERGQVTVLLAGVLAAVAVGAVVLGALADAATRHGDRQRAADLGALAGAAALRTAYPRLFPPAGVAPLPVERVLAGARAAAQRVAGANGAARVTVGFPGDRLLPLRIRVRVDGDAPGLAPAWAEAEAAMPAVAPAAGPGGAGEYHGPLAYRDGKPMRPDTALAYDRMAAAARADGITLVVVSGWRSDAEQARLFVAHPDPKWVAPPGHSLHRLGTELDLGPASAYGWLAAHASRFHFVKRYSWEPWHFGLSVNAGTVSVGYGGADRGGSALPAWVPARFLAPLARSARRWNVGAALLAAQLQAESGFDPGARSPAGALGIAQFMPGTARTYGLRDPMDPVAAIDAQAHLMRDLLRRLGSVPLALAAYNAGPGRVQACMCVPPIPETQAYVARILGLLRAAGDGAGAAADGLVLRLVR